jgi:hypothetical protein
MKYVKSVSAISNEVLYKQRKSAMHAGNAPVLFLSVTLSTDATLLLAACFCFN